MADKKEFSDFQTYKCDILTKEDLDLPKFCPTCVKDPSYVEPTWYTTDETYLDKKNCLYKFNVTKIIDDLRLEENEKRLKSFAITFTNHVQETRNYKNEAVQSKIIRTAIYNMLIDLDKEISYRHICNNYGCAPITTGKLRKKDKERIEVIIHDLKYLKESIINDIEDGDVVEFLGIQVEEIAQDFGYDPLEVSSHFEYRLNLDEGEQLSPILQVTLEKYDELLAERDRLLQSAAIDIGSFNPYGLENYAILEDKYFPASENGGNIIMVQVENEYASFDNDGLYMEQIRDYTKNAFNKSQLFRCDWGSNFDSYKLDGVATAINFGAGSNIDEQFKKFQEVYPKSPLMCSEYWTGWFDHWGRPHETRSISSFIGSLKDMLDRNISFSLYMAHGGTTFGHWGGANSPPYSSMVTSYDYNAPINEAGQPTDKFYAVRDLLKNYLNEGETLANIPKNKDVIAISEFEMKESANLFENLPKPKKTKDIQTMEMFDQGWGSVIYRTNLPAGKKGRQLVITEVHDWAAVYLNGKLLGHLDRRRNEKTIELPETTNESRLDILVDAMGRVNWGATIIDRKGITEKVELIQDEETTLLQNWEVFNIPVDAAFKKEQISTQQKVQDRHGIVLHLI